MDGLLNPINMKIPFNLIMLQDSMVLACLAKILMGNQSVRCFVQKNTSMKYHQFKHLCQRMNPKILLVAGIHDDPKVVVAPPSTASH